MDFTKYNIISTAKGKEGRYNIEFFITDNPLYSEEGEILAQFEKGVKEDNLTIIIDQEASKKITYNQAVKEVIKALENNQFNTFNGKGLFRAVLK